jgi:hypothetical protein
MKKPEEGCSCQDPYSELPSELRPKVTAKKSSLRKTVCAVCGQDYWTNRSREVCIRCEQLGRSEC